MKLALIVAVTVVGGTLLATQGPGGQILAAFNRGSTAPQYLGYVEGETTLVAPPIAGRLVARPVQRGDRVKKGERLYVIDTNQAETEVARAAAILAEFQARHANLLTGKRSEEQDVVRAQRRELEASLALAEQDLKRQTDLTAKNYVSARATTRRWRRWRSCAPGPPRSPPRNEPATLPRATPKSPPPRR